MNFIGFEINLALDLNFWNSAVGVGDGGIRVWSMTSPLANLGWNMASVEGNEKQK